MKTVWAFIRPDGRLIADSDFSSADQAWKIGLGWPDKEEIERAKKKGYRVAQVEVHVCDSNPVDVNETENMNYKLPDLGNPLQHECYMDALRAEAEKP